MLEKCEVLKSYIDGLDVVDTHEHLLPASDISRKNLDLFSFIASSYCGSDFVSAGFNQTELCSPSLKPEKKWKILKENLPVIKTT